jgi:arylsulfatase A-like enzyme
MNKPPHILIFNPDQWRGDVLGHLGDPAAVTPTLDRCVREDFVRFRHAFCQNPVCTPSRCSFMSGWYPHVRGHRTMYHMLHPERGEPVLLKTLKDHGYFVWWGGKNDLVPAQDGYGAYCDLKHAARTNVPGNHDAAFAARRGPRDGDNFYSFYLGEYPPPAHGEVFQDSDWAHVRGAADFIRNYHGEKPLCIYLPLSFPHPPYVCERPHYGTTDRRQLPPRIMPPDDWRTKPELLRRIRDLQHLTGWTEERWDELRGTYYDMCNRVDAQFALVLQALKDAGIYDDTAAFFFSDHGDFTGSYGLVEKTQNTFEDCLTRVPFLIKPPRGHAVQPRISEAMIELVDFSATVLDVAGIDADYTHFGRSLLPVVAGQRDTHRDAVFCEGGRRPGEAHCKELQSDPVGDAAGWYYPRLMAQRTGDVAHCAAAMCRTKTHKYVRRLLEDDEFYDLTADPGERHNRIHDPACAGPIAVLKDRLLQWYHETCDVVPFGTDRRG